MTVIRPRSQKDLAAEDCHGWVLAYRGKGWASSLIQRATYSPYSHVAMLVKDQRGVLDVCEVRELIGGRRQPLHVQASQYHIDVFKPVDALRDVYDPEAAAETIRLMSGTTYGYGNIWRIIVLKLPLIWRLGAITDDEARPNVAQKPNVRPICSQAVYLAMCDGGLCPIARKPSYLVTPGDIGHSPVLEPWGRVI